MDTIGTMVTLKQAQDQATAFKRDNPEHATMVQMHWQPEEIGL